MELEIGVRKGGAPKMRVFYGQKQVCCYCERHYDRLLSAPSGSKRALFCPLCKMVKYYEYENRESLVLCWSFAGQAKIVSETVAFIRKHGRIPRVVEIDDSARSLKLSLPEFASLLGSTCTLPREMRNYKVFVGKGFNKSLAAKSQASMFVAPTHVDTTVVRDVVDPVSVEAGLSEHVYNKRELAILGKHFSTPTSKTVREQAPRKVWTFALPEN